MLRYMPLVRARARGLRRRQTDAELKLWQRLRARQISMAKFRRQHPVGQFVVDFCCPEHHLVVELDGGQHSTQVRKDQRRTEILEQHGYHVLRFWDDQVLKDIEAVLNVIASATQHPHPDPLPERERENKAGKLEQ